MEKLREMSTEEQKAVQLEILSYVAKFCDDHHLRYYLSDGTLIGAIRHEGYIPWDDDIDIEMPRPDYNRLIKLFQNQKNYQLITPLQRESRFHHLKVIDVRTVKIENGIHYHNNDFLGVDIDIFAMDGCPDDEEAYKRIREKVYKRYNKYCTLKAGLSGSVKHRILFLLYRFTTLNTAGIMKKAVGLCEAYDFDHSKYAARYGRFGLGYRVPMENYSSSVIKKFEDKCFRVPVGYDAVLRAGFGDYMQLPPPEKRVVQHGNKAYWKEAPDNA